MSVDTKLYVSTRWELKDIITVLKRTTQHEVIVKSSDHVSPGYFNFFVGPLKWLVHVFTNNQTPIGTATCLTMRADDYSRGVLRDVANVLGGVLMDNDSDGLCKLIDGAMNEENALPYFLKYAIVHDGIDPKDSRALSQSRRNWERRYLK